ncbi:Uncharacterised protein g2895 [Pycnogonum litorale]
MYEFESRFLKLFRSPESFPSPSFHPSAKVYPSHCTLKRSMMSEPRAKQDKVHWINSETATVATMNGIHPPPVLPDDELRNVNMRSDRRPPMSPRYSNTAGGSDPNERGQETPTVGTMRNSKNQFTPQLLDELKRNKRFPAESITLLSGSSAMYNATSDLTESRVLSPKSIPSSASTISIEE